MRDNKMLDLEKEVADLKGLVENYEDFFRVSRVYIDYLSFSAKVEGDYRSAFKCAASGCEGCIICDYSRAQRKIENLRAAQ